MPNLWTKATQKIAEAFSGPRTKDTEFDMKVEEMKMVERGVLSLKLLFQNFLNYTVGIKNLCRDITTSVKSVLDKNSPYINLSNEISDGHLELQKFYDEFYNNVNKLNSRTSEWALLFSQAKVQMEKREETRKTYDHYDEKMEKIYKNKMEKAKKGTLETAKDLEFFQRNEDKFKKATEEYVNLSQSTYETIHTILEKRYELINPVISEFLELERIFFSSANNIFRKFEGIETRFNNITRNVEKKQNTYDACKFIRGGEIIQREKLKVLENSPLDSSRRNLSHLKQNDDNQQNRFRAKSNAPYRKEEEKNFSKGLQKNNEGYDDSKYLQSNNTTINQYAPRASEVLYQEYSGVNDNFSDDNNFNNNRGKHSQTTYHKSIYRNEENSNANNLNNFDNFDFLNNNFDKNFSLSKTNNNYKDNMNNNDNNITSNISNNNLRNVNDFDFQNNNVKNTNNVVYFNKAQNFANNSNNGQSNNNNNFDFDNIFSKNNNYNSNVNNIQGTPTNPHKLLNMPTSAPINLVYGTVKGTPKGNTPSNNISSNFKFVLPNNNTGNKNNVNTNQKSPTHDIFKDLF